ncbi:uncharacterized protein LY79DRAFT_250634 [Colletotrichum navitas]|uniref:Uncharacterized protein n=1 Tax=Colletotrichum navitas TaxID=681940 RepID=A0AAD8Q9T3_9PEZI|nr:uncharacterized protein LY79DRAFT_250634 [Colletotrichum navitas]KAK1598635.1 hypothetical protein LY79DRAFT_250634 [Colletotrichum navitas]
MMFFCRKTLASSTTIAQESHNSVSLHLPFALSPTFCSRRLRGPSQINHSILLFLPHPCKYHDTSRIKLPSLCFVGWASYVPSLSGLRLLPALFSDRQLNHGNLCLVLFTLCHQPRARQSTNFLLLFVCPGRLLGVSTSQTPMSFFAGSGCYHTTPSPT